MPVTRQDSTPPLLNSGSLSDHARLLDFVPAAAYICDADGRITAFNRHAARLWGGSPQRDGATGRFCGACQLFQLDGTPLPRERCPMALALRHGREYLDCKFILQSPDGTRRTYLASATPLRDELARVSGAINVLVDVTEQSRSSDFLCRQNAILEQIATKARLDDVFRNIVAAVEEQQPGLLCTILLREPEGAQLRLVSAPHLPEAFREAARLIPIGPRAGSCGTAAFRREPVFVSDIATDPLWTEHKDLPLAYGLRACWSTPILSRLAGEPDSAVLGTFACYVRQPGLPDPSVVAVLGRAETLLRIALDSQRADKDLRESEAFLRITQRSSRVGSWEWDFSTNRVKWSEEMAHLHGIRLSDFDGTLAMAVSFIHPDDRTVNQEHLQCLPRGAPYVPWEYRIRRADGVLRYLWPAAEIIRDAAGQPAKLLGVSMDITERIQSQEALRESEQRFRQLAESTLEGLLIHEQGIVRDVNRALLDLFGMSVPADIVGKPVLDALRLTPASREAVGRQLQSPRRGILEVEAEMSDGTIRTFETQGRPISHQGRRARVVAVRDITQRKSREQALQLFRALIDRLNDAIEVIDAATGRFLDVNERACTDLGYSREELLSLSVPDIDPLVSTAKYQQNSEKMRAAGSLSIKSLHRRRDGSCFPVEVNARLVQLDREYVLAVVRDISERVQYEEALRQSEERFRSAFELSAISMGLVSLDGRWLKVNPPVCQILGYTAEELLAGDCQSITHPDDLETSQSVARKLIEGPASNCHFEQRFLHKDGRVIWAFVTVSLVRDAAGAPSYFITQLQDITHRKETERQLSETSRSREELLALLDTLQFKAPIGLAFIDLDLRYVRCNDALAEINGVPAAEHLGKKVAEIVPHLWPQLQDMYRHVLSGRGPLLNQEVSGETAARPGVIRHWLANYYPVTIGTELIGVGLIVHEITQQRRLAEQVRHAHKMEAVGRLAGGIAHDFNNLLTVINGHSQLMLERMPPGDRGHGSLTAIQEAGRRAVSLVRQLLAFSRSQALQLVRLDLNEVLAQFEGLLCRLVGDKIKLLIQPAPDLAAVRADRSQMEQVLMNLVVNARDAMLHGGTLTIRTGNVELTDHRLGMGEELKPGAYVRLSVADTGMGMTAEVKAKLFEPFFTTKETGKGTGLGLPAVHGIVQQSGGQIEVESEVGVGSCITILLPAEAVVGPATGT